jgi:hypothetical protein
MCSSGRAVGVKGACGDGGDGIETGAHTASAVWASPALASQLGQARAFCGREHACLSMACQPHQTKRRGASSARSSDLATLRGSLRLGFRLSQILAMTQLSSLWNAQAKSCISLRCSLQTWLCGGSIVLRVARIRTAVKKCTDSARLGHFPSTPSHENVLRVRELQLQCRALPAHQRVREVTAHPHAQRRLGVGSPTRPASR